MKTVISKDGTTIAFDQFGQGPALILILPWTNKFATMSWEEWLDFNPIESVEGIRVPSLVIHSDNAAPPDNAREFFERFQTPQKRLIWRIEPHFDFYDRDASKIAAREIAAHFKSVLME